MSITTQLATSIKTYQFEALPKTSIQIAKQCILDWFGVTLAAIDEPLVKILKEELVDEKGKVTLFGKGKASPLNAALINGANGHALDYDDSNQLMMGHPTAPVLPAVLALAELKNATGKELITAFIAGYETACRVSALIGISHYEVGFHPTATMGTFGAAAACGHLLALNENQLEQALSIASCQSAGLKSMFGSFSKPFQVGKAAMNGLLAAKLAQKDFTGGENALEHSQGFFATHHVQAESPNLLKNGAYIQNTLFKYHAACHLTHSEIIALKALRAKGIRPEHIESVQLEVPEFFLDICNIPNPKTPLETKFSMKHIAAMVLYGTDTATMSSYSQACADDLRYAILREKVRVIGNQPKGMAAQVTVKTKEGGTHVKRADVGVVETDLRKQQNQIEEKFMALSKEVIGKESAAKICRLINNLEQEKNLQNLIKLI